MKTLMYVLTLALVLAGFSCKGKEEKKDHAKHSGHSEHSMKQKEEKVNVKTDKIIIKNGWARENIPPTKLSAGFMIIENPTDTEDVLLKAESGVSNVVEVHEMVHKDDKMMMQEVKDGIKIPAKGKIMLKPGGFHIMFIDLKNDIKKGETVEMTLHFKNAGAQTITVPVKKLMMKMKGHGGH